MAGDWIPRQKGLSKKPEVLRIASMTGLDRHQVADILMEFWEWADEVTNDGILSGFSVRILSASCPLDVRSMSMTPENLTATFWDAVVKVGWLRVGEDQLEIPNYERWLGRNAKKRAQDVHRKRMSREFRELSEDCPPDKRTENGKELESNRKSAGQKSDRKRTTEDRRQKTDNTSENRKTRELNPIWDALSESCGFKPITKNDKAYFASSVKELTEKGATADEVRSRAARYREKWPTMDLTHNALAKHWHLFAAPSHNEQAESARQREIEATQKLLEDQRRRDQEIQNERNENHEPDERDDDSRD